MHHAKTPELLRLSRMLRAAADGQDWEQVQTLEAERSRLLTGYDAREELGLGKDYVQASLEEMLEINRHVLALGTQLRDEVAAGAATLRRGVRAGKAYSQTE